MSHRRSHDLIKIAQVLKSNGTGGEIVLGTSDIAPEEIDCKEPVFINFDGLPVPFFIESFIPKATNKAIVHLTGIESFEDAEEIVGKDIFADKETYADIFGSKDDLSFLVGWSLFDAGKASTSGTSAESDLKDVVRIGAITDYLDIPNNPCIEVETKKGAVNIPLHEDFIISVDPDRREIVMEIPEGLLDI